MSNRLEFQTVVLAALLHDLGKLLQRGRTLPFDVEGSHPEVSLRFVSAFAETFQQVADLELLKTLVLCHHRGHRFSGLKIEDISEPRACLLAYLVDKADGLSAKERGQHAAQWQDFKTTPLASVFLRVFASRDQAGGANYHPSALTTSESLSNALFPAAFENYKSGELEEALRVFGNKAKPLLKVMGEDFDRRYEEIYGRGAGYRGAGVEATKIRVEGRFRPPIVMAGEVKAPLKRIKPAGAVKYRRKAYFPKESWIDIEIYDEKKLGPGNILPGPCIVERYADTVVIPPHAQGVVDRYLNIQITFE